jgi:hypothetical protein
MVAGQASGGQIDPCQGREAVSGDIATDLGIPYLDLRRQVTRLTPPVVPYGSVARTTEMKGTFHFYISDQKFSRLCAMPERLLRSGCRAAFEANFSAGSKTPRIRALYDIYRKRALARFWQDCGLRIIVDLNVYPTFHDIALLGVPAGWRAYSTRCHKGWSESEIEVEHSLAVDHAGSESGLLFVVVGGGKAAKAMCKSRGWTHVPEHCHVIRGRAEAYG